MPTSFGVDWLDITRKLLANLHGSSVVPPSVRGRLMVLKKRLTPEEMAQAIQSAPGEAQEQLREWLNGV